MKVLIVHQHFKSPYKGGAVRSYYLAKALVDIGVEVEVITAHNENYNTETIDDFTVRYLNVPYHNSFGFIKRVISFIRFSRRCVDEVKKIKHIDLCYAISVPLTVGIAARKIKRRFGIPFVFEVGDLWPEAPIQMGYIKNGLLKKFLFNLEKEIYQSAEAIVALSPSIKESIEAKAVKKEVYVIPNMSDTDFFSKASKDPVEVQKWKVQNKFVVSYLGAIGEANGLDYFINCATAALKADLPIHFILCGEGAHQQRLAREIETMQLHNITMVPFTNRAGVKEILDITDAAFICYKPVPILETGSPNKYFDALASGKLVVVNFSGWICNEIEENRCGVYVDPLQPSDFVRKIKPFISDKILLESYQFNARTLAEKSYSRRYLSSQFCKVIVKTSLGGLKL